MRGNKLIFLTLVVVLISSGCYQSRGDISQPLFEVQSSIASLDKKVEDLSSKVTLLEQNVARQERERDSSLLPCDAEVVRKFKLSFQCPKDWLMHNRLDFTERPYLELVSPERSKLFAEFGGGDIEISFPKNDDQQDILEYMEKTYDYELVNLERTIETSMNQHGLKIYKLGGLASNRGADAYGMQIERRIVNILDSYGVEPENTNMIQELIQSLQKI